VTGTAFVVLLLPPVFLLFLVLMFVWTVWGLVERRTPLSIGFAVAALIVLVLGVLGGWWWWLNVASVKGPMP
jgi:hypothetical protein